MRALCLLLCAVVAYGCSQAGGSPRPASVVPRPPVIRAPFLASPLPCPSEQRTTIHMIGCAEHATAAADAAVNGAAVRVFSLIGNSVLADRRVVEWSFVRAERAWKAYRDTLCETESGSTSPAPGSVSPVWALGCAEQLDRAHVRELAAASSFMCSLRQGLVERYRRGCPVK